MLLNVGGSSSNPGQGNEVPHAAWHGQIKKQTNKQKKKPWVFLLFFEAGCPVISFCFISFVLHYYHSLALLILLLVFTEKVNNRLLSRTCTDKQEQCVDMGVGMWMLYKVLTYIRYAIKNLEGHH